MKNFINEKYPNARIMEVDVEDNRNDWDFGYTEVDIIHNGIPKMYCSTRLEIGILLHGKYVRMNCLKR